MKVTPKPKTSTDKEQCVPVRIKDEDSDDTTTSGTDTDKPKPPTPEPPAADNSSQTPHTPQRNFTPGEFPTDTPLDAIHVRLPAEPQPQEEAYPQRPRRTNAGKFTSTRFHDESFSSLAIHQPNTNPGGFCALQSISTSEPTTYAEAISGANHEQWKAAIDDSEELEFVTGRTGPRKTRAPGPFPRPAPLKGLGRGVFFGIPCPCRPSGPRPTKTPDGSPLKMGGNKRGPSRE